MDMQARIAERLAQGIELKKTVLADTGIHDLLARIVADIIASLGPEPGGAGRVFFAGNGGSFSDSIHLAGEFVSRFMFDRAPLSGMALGANNSIMSAIGNDYSFDDVFVRELAAMARPGDVFIGLSTSGNSPNIVACVQAAAGLGVKAYCMTGATGGALADLCPCLKVPSTVTARIQEIHITLGHILCELVEEALCGGA